MSAKKSKTKKSGKRVALWTILVVEVVILVAAGLCLWALTYDSKHAVPDQPQPSLEAAVDTEPSKTDATHAPVESDQPATPEDTSADAPDSSTPEETTAETVNPAETEDTTVEETSKPVNPEDTTAETTKSTKPEETTAETTQPTVPEVTSPKETTPKETTPKETTPKETKPARVEEVTNTESVMDKRLKIVNVGSYTGVYMEDGSDEIVSDVLMLVVENYSTEDVQYAEITLPTENGDAKFTLTTLPAGKSCVLLELNRMTHTGSEDVSKAVSDNVAVFPDPMNLCQDQLKLQILDGAINVTNISGSDLTGEVCIYYKNAASDLYYGGITYRVRIEDGLKAGEIKQIMASHFSNAGSKIMFVTIS